jgi:2-polyprenyl-6-hydroxyphenyl methylase/3-demethylubiquinone-9 3-methyltransferase
VTEPGPISGPGPPRFNFGSNWQAFARHIDAERIAEAEASLREMLGADSLEGSTFLDIGSGSGLFSLAAWRLGATAVRSLDFDPDSVLCTADLRERFTDDPPNWQVQRGDVLDRVGMAQLGPFDIVYSWGVLHHTGDLWRALANVAPMVAPGGRLFVSIYNDQGLKSRLWLVVKRVYNRLPSRLKLPFLVLVAVPREGLSLAKALAEGRPGRYVGYWTQYKRRRGMSRWHDIVDWIGGYPFQVARPEEVFHFLRDRSFVLDRLVTVAGGTGCNEFVFTRLGSVED